MTNQISAHAIQETVLPVSSQVGICDTLRVATELLVWSHDKPGSAALSGQELAYSWADTSGVWHPWQQVTDDSLADWTPRAAFVNDETAQAVWQRFDSSTPGDPNADPSGYVSHLQVAAARWSAASNTWSAPQQLSQSGSVNTRPQVGALGDGALVVWVNNPSNQIIGDVAHPDTIQFARYTLSTNAWTTATTVISELTGRPTTSVNRWTSKRVLPQFGLFAGGWMGICQGFPAQIVRVS